MNQLSQVKRGRLEESLCILLYGVDGVGKSSFGASAPSPIFLGAEQGTSQLDVARLPQPLKFSDCVKAVQELQTSTHDYKTLVIDSLDWMEPLIWNEVVDESMPRVSDISKIGWNKGYDLAALKLRKFISELSSLKNSGMNILLLAHSKIKIFNDPTATQGYDKYILAMRDDTSNIWRQFADAVLFMNYEIFTKDGSRRGYGEGLRVMYTEERPSFQAKSRFALPFRIAVHKNSGWKCLTDAIEANEPNSLEQIIDSINSFKSRIVDAELLKKINSAIDGASTDILALTEIRDRLMALTVDLK
ncbi:MAG: ATP-binding protein [Rhabdochlamydiaceae bacterium]